MTPDEAREIERLWGEPGPSPGDDWRCCWRCGEWWPRESRLWCMPHRLCRACKKDEKRGIWPVAVHWHRKNRWDEGGRLSRRCCTCHQWKPLVDYYLVTKRDKPGRTNRLYPYPECITCTRRRRRERLSIPELRRRILA